MVSEAPLPHNPELLDDETVRTIAESLIVRFNKALRNLPELQNRFKTLDKPLKKNDPFIFVDQLIDKQFANYGGFDHNDISYIFECLGNPERLVLFGLPRITEPVYILKIADTPLLDGERLCLSLSTTPPRISWMNEIIEDGVQTSIEEFYNNNLAVGKAEMLLQRIQTSVSTP